MPTNSETIFHLESNLHAFYSYLYVCQTKWTVEKVRHFHLLFVLYSGSELNLAMNSCSLSQTNLSCTCKHSANAGYYTNAYRSKLYKYQWQFLIIENEWYKWHPLQMCNHSNGGGWPDTQNKQHTHYKDANYR